MRNIVIILFVCTFVVLSHQFSIENGEVEELEQMDDNDKSAVKKKPPAKLPGPKLTETELAKTPELSGENINVESYETLLAEEKGKKGKKSAEFAPSDYNPKKTKDDNLIPVNGSKKPKDREEAKRYMNRDAGLPDSPQQFVNKNPEESTQIPVSS